MTIQKKSLKNQRLTKKLTYIIPKKNGEISSMNLFIICFTSAALLYVLTLPFIGKRSAKKKEPIKPIKHNHKSWEVSAISYNRKHGLPDDAI